jgi:1-acyl-sn-glycerol-3-phosphate acyltransferase
MIDLLRGVRSLVSVLLVGLWFAVGSIALRLVVVPGCWLFPSRQQLLVSTYMKAISRGILGLLTLGGARFRRVGRLPTASPMLAVANHQSLLDIPQVTLLSTPRVPAFVTRKRYARFVPLVSQSVRLLESPIVDPRRDPRGAVAEIRRGARELRHGMLIFAEGHRTKDGTIRPFRAAGVQAILQERQLPVYLVLNEGAWRVARLSDLLFRVHLIDAVCEVIGPFEPPRDSAEVPRFVEELRARLVRRLAEIRGEMPSAPAA